LSTRPSAFGDDEYFKQKNHMHYREFYYGSGFPLYATEAVIKERDKFSTILSPQYQAFFQLGLFLYGIRFNEVVPK